MARVIPITDVLDESEQAGFDYESHRPLLQRDSIAHVLTLPEDVDPFAQKWAPHVALIYDNLSYSLFRPSSSPSGDDEEVLFGDAQEGHFLYYANLETLATHLHQTFPQLRGDGDNELVFDFGILDMQISEVYFKFPQFLTLYGFDTV